MFDPEEIPELKKVIRECALADRKILDDLVKEVQILRNNVKSIKPRNVTSISFVASDGGNNKLAYDPFYFQLVRVVDSNGKQLCLDTISPTTDTDVLSARQFNDDGSPKTKLGQMMFDLGCTKLYELSPMIPKGELIRTTPERISTSWVLVYRDICEWAVLYYKICHSNFANNTLIILDGLLRSKLFSKNLFIEIGERISNSIDKIYRDEKVKVFLVGVAKHSKVLDKYGLAISIENIIPPGEPRYVYIPRELQAKAYVWPEYSKGVGDENSSEGEAPKFVLGDMFFVRFGKMSGDPIWIVDIFYKHKTLDQEIFGYLLTDAIYGFPVPYYPLCLQRAHEYAQVVDFDMDILQDEVVKAIKEILPKEAHEIIDQKVFNSDKSQNRYG